MGDAGPQQKETLLCILPFPEPLAIIKSLREKYPHVKIIYEQLTSSPPRKIDDGALSTSTPDSVSPSHYFNASSNMSTDRYSALYAQATILCTLSTLPDAPEKIPNVKFIHFFSAGIDHIASHPIYTHSDITLTTSSGIHGPMIAEWVILQILSKSHRQKLLLQWQREHKWGSHGSLPDLKDAVGMRVGVLGYGSIGRQGM
jgi:lactate dehydrogenase-like 2-hydroxyacid dehydrogenase